MHAEWQQRYVFLSHSFNFIVTLRPFKAMLTEPEDMRENFVIDPLIGKRQQLLLATQLCRMVLKINNVIIAGSDEQDF